jgi:hypothetical protein
MKILTIKIIVGDFWGIRGRGRERKDTEGWRWSKYDTHTHTQAHMCIYIYIYIYIYTYVRVYIYTLFENGGRALTKYNRGHEPVQSKLYTSMELLQWNTLVLLVYVS